MIRSTVFAILMSVNIVPMVAIAALVKILRGFGMAMLARYARGATIRGAAGVAAVVVLCGSPIATAQTVTEFTIPTAASRPFGIAAGPDGALWFVEGDGNKIGRITTAGAFTEYTIPTKTNFGNFSSHPQCIVAGPDGAMWFVEGDGNKIGRIDTAGKITEFANFAGGWPQCLTAGPDGALWIADQGPMGGGAASGDGWIGRITTAGVLTKFPLPRKNVQANFITAGPDGALWFGTADDKGNSTIGRITTAGAVTEFPVPTPGAVVFGITAGPDGALWFAEANLDKIGRITTTGIVTEFPVPTAGSGPTWLVTGPDGALWYTASSPAPSGNGDLTFTGDKIGRITTSGAVTEFTLPTAGSGPVVIVAGPDGALWFTEATASKIGKLTLPPPAPPAPAPLDPTKTVSLPPVTQAAYTAATGQLPEAAVQVSATGTFGSATLRVTLDLAKAIPAAFAASATYNVYVAALVPGALIGAASPAFYIKSSTLSWGPIKSPLAAYLENVTQGAADNKVLIEILANTDISSLPGTEIYVGYGTSDTEMLTSGRYRGVYKVQ